MSDSLTIDTANQQVTRQPRRDRVEADNSEPRSAVAAGDGPVEQQEQDANDPEQMLAESRKALERSEAELAATRTRESEARTQAARARDEAARANMGRASDRAAAVASAIEAAKADITSAKIAKRTAREAGDIDAEMAADEMLSSALYRQNQATGELNWINQQARQPAPTGDQGNRAEQDKPTPAAQAWMDSHPRFNTDRNYRATALGAHTEALRAGKTLGSQEYVDYIDQMVEEVYGPDHGTSSEPPLARRQQPMQPTQRNNATSAAGPSNRGSGGSTAGGGSGVVQTGLGPITVQRRQDGSKSITIPRNRYDDWMEAATINGMTLDKYAEEQVAIADEMAAGGDAGWKKGEGLSAS